MKKIIRWIFNMILGVVFVIALLLTVPPVMGIQPYVVLSGSMEPVLPTGGIVYTDTGKKDFSQGDIISYRLGDSIVTHRIVKKQSGCYITQGDANNCQDPLPVEHSQIIGQAVFALPLLGYMVSALHTRISFAATFISAALSVLLNLAYTPNRNKNKGE